MSICSQFSVVFAVCGPHPIHVAILGGYWAVLIVLLQGHTIALVGLPIKRCKINGSFPSSSNSLSSVSSVYVCYWRIHVRLCILPWHKSLRRGRLKSPCRIFGSKANPLESHMAKPQHNSSVPLWWQTESEGKKKNISVSTLNYVCWLANNQ